ncbi:hypothetical protein PE067_14045 [Paracoccus sp. DMF-8]|uniref:hypothetical protein n=1 Tax=Paracoccus sp. DMF-8 TaxID=3019445 RepID=UPI0023E7ABF0|nr:hypothetical protein [Paracoccus sp. DMF-8]MDF3607157.1 hypothetical protein [Paracoccus sp. DMF-8]
MSDFVNRAGGQRRRRFANADIGTYGALASKPVADSTDINGAGNAASLSSIGNR